MSALLEVDRLTVRYGRLTAVDGVSLAVERGEALGIVGESGSGKSTLLRAVLRLLPRGAEVEGGVRLDGTDLLPLSAPEMNRLRWQRLAVVFQDALSSLDPVYRVHDQITEAIRAHQSVDRAEGRRRAGALLERMGVAAHFGGCFPHQLSGGMCQRAAIAMAVALEPDLLLLDEPTTALDVVTQAQVLREIGSRARGASGSLVLVSHDIAVVNQLCDRLLVLYAGQVAEVGPVRAVFRGAAHPYAIGLLHATPTLDAGDPPLSMPGSLPGVARAEGCVFAPRCPFSQPVCRRERPPLVAVGPGHVAACHFAEDAGRLREQARDPRTWSGVV